MRAQKLTADELVHLADCHLITQKPMLFVCNIGENDIASRAEICAGLGARGIVVDAKRNNVRGTAVISNEKSPVTVRVIPPLEDLMIVNHVVRLLNE